MTKLRELYESKKFEDFKLTINKEIASINELLKIIYGDTAEFDEKGFITHYKPSNVVYEYDVNELTYVLGVEKFGQLLTETYFHNFLPEYDFDNLKDEEKTTVDVFIQVENGDVGKDTIKINKFGPSYLNKTICYHTHKKDSVEKTDLCIPNFDKEDKYPSIIHKSLINNNLFYTIGNEIAVICKNDIRLVTFEYDNKTRVITIGDQKLSLVSGELL